MTCLRHWVRVTTRHLLHFRPHHLKSLRRPGVLHPSHAADEIQRIPVQFAVFKMRIVDVNRNNLADHEATAGGRGRKVENLMKLALEADRRFGDSGRPHDLRRLWRQLRYVEFVHQRIVFAAARIHRLAKFVRNDVDDEFPRLTNVPQRILSFAVAGFGLLGLPKSGRKRQQRRIDANRIKKKRKARG